MIFIDSNVFIYAVGRPHPLRSEAQNFFIDSRTAGIKLVTSAEVLQELMHAYLPVGRLSTLDAALELATTGTDEIIPITVDIVMQSRLLADKHPQLTARDLLHLAVCNLRKVTQIKTFDRGLFTAFAARPR